MTIEKCEHEYIDEGVLGLPECKNCGLQKSTIESLESLDIAIKKKEEPAVLQAYIPDNRVSKLTESLRDLIDKECEGMSLASVIGCLDIIKYEVLDEAKQC